LPLLVITFERCRRLLLKFDLLCVLRNSNACTASAQWISFAYNGECKSEIPEEKSIPETILENSGSTLPVSEDTLSWELSSLNPEEDKMLSGEAKILDIQTDLLSYSNPAIGYSLQLPKWSYYQWYGAWDGASHRLWVQLGSSPESFETSEAQIFWYKWRKNSQKIQPELFQSDNQDRKIVQEESNTFMRVWENLIQIHKKSDAAEWIEQVILKTVQTIAD
jgi:hypothetical protein